MSKKFTLGQLTEGIRSRHMGDHGRRLTEKWTRTGLLRGLDGVHRENMAQLLENQAGQILREQNTLGGGGLAPSAAQGDIRGFTNIAFPIVRRVFGGLVANELVSIQPMSLPSGLLFYLDYTYGTNMGGTQTTNSTDNTGLGTASKSVYTKGQSIYNNPAGAGIRSGSLGTGGMYDLAGTGYSRVHDTADVTLAASRVFTLGTSAAQSRTAAAAPGIGGATATLAGADGRFAQFDPQVARAIETQGGKFIFAAVPIAAGTLPAYDVTMVKEAALVLSGTSTSGGLNTATDLAVPGETWQGGTGVYNIRRLNQLVIAATGTTDISSAPMARPATANACILMVLSGTAVNAADLDAFAVTYPKANVLDVGATGDTDAASTLVVPVFESNFNTTPQPQIPEIDIKIESVSVVASTRKLRARWSPELAQDLNAYHSLDAEVELTQILSEQIALEIDREILNDLLQQADTNYYWSRMPGRFVNKRNGANVFVDGGLAATVGSRPGGPSFTGTVREWYETLVETVIDVANEIHRKTLRGSANFCVVSPDVATILEASVLYRPSYTLDGDGQVTGGMTLGCEKVGTLSNRFTVYKDPYFPRNKILVGYKGGSYLETGYVYAPYVPLIVTPTIFAPEDFTPRKGVMTRYGKKMVRSDFYGTVTIQHMDVI